MFSWKKGYLAWVALVLLTAQLLGFRADGATAITWPIALMLTPYGLIENLLLSANEALHRYYAQSPPGWSLAEQDRWYWHYLQIYLQSNLLEVIVLARWWRTVSVVNSITHPIVFFVIMRLPLPYLSCILLAETFAVVAEGFAYRRVGIVRPFLASLLANLVSWQLAPFLTVYFFLWDKLV